MIERALSFAQARTHVLRHATPLASETIALGSALGRALREDIVAPHPLPPFDNSAMDGFAVRARDLEAASQRGAVELAVVDVIPAGAARVRALRAGEAARIMTGAPLPPGADSIVPFEDCERLGGSPERARFTAATPGAAHVRRAGADIAEGALALSAGRELSPYDLALLAALGRARIEAGRRPQVAIVSTGDELRDVDAPLGPGAIHDSNAPMLRALLEDSGCDVASIERVRDKTGAASRAILDALARADVVLSIGGVSAGDFDPVKTDLALIPGAELWRVAMKPGRPQAFAAHSGRLFFGLPGNPGSVACVFETLVRPALRRLQGFTHLDRPRIRVRSAARIESRPGRTDFVRVRLRWRDGAWWAEPCGHQISGHLTPQSNAHALLIVPPAAAALEAGESAGALLWLWPEEFRTRG